MASFIARSRPQKPLTICEACLGHSAVPRKPATASFRFFSIASRPVSTRILDGERTSNRARTRIRRYSSVPSTTIAGESNLDAELEETKRGPFLTQEYAQSDAPSEAQYARLTNRRLIALSGPDAAKFLNGLITNNVDPKRTEPFYAAFLDARGRMLHDVFIWTYPNMHSQKEMIGGRGMGDWACYIDVADNEVQALVKHLKRHKLRSKIDIRIVEETVEKEGNDFEDPQVWAIWGDHKAISDSYESIVTFKDPRFITDQVTMQRSLLRPVGTSNPANYDNASFKDYTKLRYRYGVIEGEEIPKETQTLNKGNALPMEFNVDISQGIDFKKGCYVGQELTIRTKHTGVVRKRILPVELSAYPPPHTESDSPDQVPTLDMQRLREPLDPLQFESGDIKQLDDNGKIKKGRAAGKVISVAGNLGLALCRLEMMTPMKISAEGGSWRPGLEFGMQDREGSVIRVRPFVRDEWVTSVRNLWDKKRERI